jgi:hypothetical protein
MVEGRGICAAECGCFLQNNSPGVGWCRRGDFYSPTRDGAYCGRWVEQREREAAAREQQVHALTIRVDELQAERRETEREAAKTVHPKPCKCGRAYVRNGEWLSCPPCSKSFYSQEVAR